jgi:hypothetical protein
MSSTPNEPEVEDVDVADMPAGTPEVEADTESDPALDDSTATEWAAEGGAVDEGPATDTD